MADETIVDKFIIEEMKVVRDRINYEIDVINRAEILSIGLVGAVVALIFQYKISSRIPLFVITSLPGLVGIYGYYRYRTHAEIIEKYNDYAKEIEERIRQKDDAFVGLVTAYQANKRKSRIRTLRTWIWKAIIIFSIVLTVILQWDPAMLLSPTQPK